MVGNIGTVGAKGIIDGTNGRTLNDTFMQMVQTQNSHHIRVHDMSRIVRKPDFCICENKDADQLRSNCAAPLYSLHR